jgi:hypothetical protein
MARMVVLHDAVSGAGVADATTAGALARLGVTSVTVLGDEDGIAVVLEGRAFDPPVAGAEAAAIVTGSCVPSCRRRSRRDRPKY